MVMVRKNTLTKTFKTILCLISSLAVLAIPSTLARSTYAKVCTTTAGIDADGNPTTAVGTDAAGNPTCDENVNFQVNVSEILWVSLTTPSADSWASGNVSTFLTNKVGLNVTSNNSAGFIASMTTSTEAVGSNPGTNLVNKQNSNSYLQTLASTVTLADITDSTNQFTTNRWGYGLSNNNTTSYESANVTAPTQFSALVPKGAATPISVLAKNAPGTGSKDIYFGAKADDTVASGTYAETVIISVVSGVNSDPVTPVDPVTPIEPTPENPTPTNPDYIASADDTDTQKNGYTVYTTTTTSGTAPSATTTTTTEVSRGGNRSSYTAPQGVTTTTAKVNEGTPLATGLAVTAGIAAVTGVTFFILAKRRKDDDEEEDY